MAAQYPALLPLGPESLESDGEGGALDSAEEEENGPGSAEEDSEGENLEA